MGKFFAIIGAIAFYLFYPLLLLVIVFGPIMEFSILLDIYQLGAPRAGMTLGVLAFLGFLLFLSYKIPRLGWLYRKLPVFMPFLQICFITLIGIELGIFFANMWADKQLFSKGVAILLTIISIVVLRLYLSYWYYKYPISYKVHKL
ncbi:hypothetical protein ACQKMN_02675 [Ureibacillus composti]